MEFWLFSFFITVYKIIKLLVRCRTSYISQNHFSLQFVIKTVNALLRPACVNLFGHSNYKLFNYKFCWRGFKNLDSNNALSLRIVLQLYRFKLLNGNRHSIVSKIDNTVLKFNNNIYRVMDTFSENSNFLEAYLPTT